MPREDGVTTSIDCEGITGTAGVMGSGGDAAPERAH